MKTVIRADASVHIGTGHIMRCLSLAEKLRNANVDVSFVSREVPGNMNDWIEKKKYKLHRLSADESDIEKMRAILLDQSSIDCLIVDHYALDHRWETPLRSYVKKIMVIDDLANRKHDCDLLLDQNLFKNLQSRYQGLVPDHCRQLLGPRYALLKNEFEKVRARLKKREGRVKRILVSLGGVDKKNQTIKVLKAIQKLESPGVLVDVVVGKANPHQAQIRELIETMPQVTFRCQVENMATLMAGADLAIGAGGTSTWERCFLGLPSLTLICADNQSDITEAVSHSGAAYNLGYCDRVTVGHITAVLQKVLLDAELLKKMSHNAFKLMNPNGFSVQSLFDH